MTVRGNFDQMPAELPYPGVTRRSFNADRATVTSYTFAPGATFPKHHHAQEQITLVEAGEVEMTIGNNVERLAAGDWSVIEPDVEHGITAGRGGATVLAVVVPRRESGDAYTVVG
jgi:quercetin dioxygenase-like cupin family protein